MTALTAPQSLYLLGKASLTKVVVFTEDVDLVGGGSKNL